MSKIISIITILFYLPAVLILSPFVFYSMVQQIRHDIGGSGKKVNEYFNDDAFAKRHFNSIMDLFKKLKPFAIVISALFYFIIFRYFTA